MNKKFSLFVPGRLCLFGEHSDWAGTYMSRNADVVEGQAIVTGINLGIYADISVSDRFDVISIDEDGNRVQISYEMDSSALKKKAQKKDFFSYCCGTAAYICENYHVGGIRINITKVTLPMKKGLSSSAAICCLVAKAFNEMYGLNISTKGIMHVAYRGELLTGSRCGRLDQACAYGERPILMHFEENEIEVDKLRVGKTLYWVIADLCAEKDTKKILAYLNKAYPFATGEKESAVQNALGIENHKIIKKVRSAFENGDAEELGRLMTEAQKLFDDCVAPMCPDELRAPVLHSVLNDPKLLPWIYGAKGVGSQGDGTVQILAKNKAAQKCVVDYLNNECKMSAFPFEINAGGKVRKAIIPIAGMGTRMFPETFFIKKAFLPIITEDGVAKPVILCMIEELIEADIEDIYLIIGADEEEEYNRLFKFDYDKSFEQKLPDNVAKYYEKIWNVGQRIHLVIQKEKRGFGHAVYQAREYLNGEPAVLMLGDFIYKSNLPISCVRQTINAYYKTNGKNVIAVKSIPFENSKTYGIVHGKFDEDRAYLMNVDRMDEKPDEFFARENLAVDGKCYATFGQYVLTDDVFQTLETQIDKQEYAISQGEIVSEVDLTFALTSQAQRGNLTGVDVDGESYDVGIPSMYYDTFMKYHKVHND